MGACRLPKTKTPWYLPCLHAFPTSDPQAISGSWQELGPYCSQAKMSFLWPSLFPKAACCRNVFFMLEISAWKREKDLSHQQQSGSNRGAGKNTRQPNLHSHEWKWGIPESFKFYLTSTFPTHSLAHVHSLEKHWQVTLASFQLHK